MASQGTMSPEIVPNWHSPAEREKRRVAIARECEGAMRAIMAQRPRAPERVVASPVALSGTIYFVGPEGGPIKIGFATRLDFRLKDLRTMNAFPLEVWATTEGPATLERDYHKRFAAHRLHGEWFSPHPDILAEIERLQG